MSTPAGPVNKVTPAARSKARRFAMQALYQIQMTDCSASSVEQEFLQDHDMKRVDREYLHALLAGTSSHKQDLVNLVTPKLARDFTELDPVEIKIKAMDLKKILFMGQQEIKVDIHFCIFQRGFRHSVKEQSQVSQCDGSFQTHIFEGSEQG